MAVQYQMRAFRNTSGAQGYVYWVSENYPDTDGSIWESQTVSPGEPARVKSDLTQISINRSYQFVFPADASNFGTIRLSKDLGGTATDPKVVGLHGKAVDPTPPTSNQGLIYDGTNWKNTTIDNSFVSGALNVGPNKVVWSNNSNVVSGITVPSTTASNYSVLMLQPDGSLAFQKVNQDMIDNGFSINSFATSPSAVVEIGTTIAQPTFSMSYNKTPTSVKISNDYGDPSFPTEETVLSPFSTFQTSLSLTKSTASSVTFTLKATDGISAEKTKTTVFTWGYKVYYGVGSAWSSLNSGQKSSLLTSISNNIKTSRNAVFTTNASSGQYIYYIYPAYFGSGTFTTNLTGGFDLVDPSYSVSINGISTTYYIYQSTRDNLGSQTVTVT